MLTTLLEGTLGSGSRVLDLGCGPGANHPLLSATGAAVFGCELDGTLVQEYANAMENRLLCRGDGTKLPYPNGTFDGVALIEVLEHLPTDIGHEILVECARVLRPGAALVVGVPTGYTEKMITRLHPQYLNNSGHVRNFSPTELVATVQAAGFSSVELRTTNLEAGLAWMLHALLRSDARMDGRVTEHRWVDTLVWGTIGLLRRVPLLARAIEQIGRRFGKSYYLRALRTS